MLLTQWQRRRRGATRQVVFGEAEWATPVWHREELAPGMFGTGPGIVITGESTNVVAPGWGWRIDAAGTLVMVRDGSGGPTHRDEAAMNGARGRVVGIEKQIPFGDDKNKGDKDKEAKTQDPIEFEIFKNFFVSVAEEMGGSALPDGLFAEHQGAAGL